MSILDRTFHPDEANQAFTTGKLLETGIYTYRPTDHHGPTLYYAAAPIQQAFGHHTTADLDGTLLRCTPLIFAVAGLVFLYLAVLRLVRRATELTGWKSFAVPLIPVVLLATAPLYVFYATDFIQETLLVCFTLMMFWAAMGYCLPGTKFKRGTWALLFGIGAGLAFATKETCVMTFAAFGGAALPFLIASNRRQHKSPFMPLNPEHLLLAFAGFLLTGVMLFSGFGRDFSGVYNAFIAAPGSYLHRAAGDAVSEGAAWHVHPWWQHLQWLFLGNSGKPDKFGVRWDQFQNLKPLIHWLLLMLPCGLVTLFRKPFQQGEHSNRPLLCAFLGASLYTVLILVFYSAIPYKTPWCTLQILVPYLVSVGLGYLLVYDLFRDRIFSRTTRLARFVGPLMLLVALPLSMVQEHVPGLRLLASAPDSPHIPYNYAHAHPEVKQLAACVAEALTEANRPAVGPVAQENVNRHPFAAVALPSTDTWPFPFYNRKFESQTGYWVKFENLVELERSGKKPSVVIVPMEEGHLAQALFPQLKHTKRFYIRPGVRVRVFW